MSSPVQDDVDKRFMYAPPWARETPQQPPQAIIAAIERLRQERLRAAAPSPDDTTADTARSSEAQADRAQPELPLGERASLVDIELAMADVVRASWTPPPLDPVVMPDPPKPRLGGPTWGMLARLAGAAGFAAAVALFVTGAVPLPSIDISLTAGEGARAASAFVQVFARRDASEPIPAHVVVADASPAAPLPASPVASSAPASSVLPSVTPASASLPPQVVGAFASLDTAAVGPAARLPGPKVETPQAAAPLAVKPIENQALDQEELAGLIKRGQALLAEGDISSARLLLRRAAEAGDGTSALMLAGTYDRAELAKLKVIGLSHDHAQAKLWYAKAVANGSAEAVRRLQQLAQRAD